MAAVVRLVAPASVWHGMHVPNVGQECVLRRSTSLMSSRTARRCCKETKRSPIGSCGGGPPDHLHEDARRHLLFIFTKTHEVDGAARTSSSTTSDRSALAWFL